MGPRAGEINQFLRFVGIGRAQDEQNGVQSYVQRTLLVYIGWRIFEDNPVGGAGWQASTEYRVYGPYEPPNGARFNDSKLLLDPYAKAVAGKIDWDNSLFAYKLGAEQEDFELCESDSAPYVPKAAVIDNRASQQAACWSCSITKVSNSSPKPTSHHSTAHTSRPTRASPDMPRDIPCRSNCHMPTPAPVTSNRLPMKVALSSGMSL